MFHDLRPTFAAKQPCKMTWMWKKTGSTLGNYDAGFTLRTRTYYHAVKTG